MALRIPVDFLAEFRGTAPAGQFRARESGELVDIPPKFKFEIEVGDGDDVDLLTLSQSVLDKATADFPIASLRRGERVRIRGSVLLQDRGSDRDSYVSVHSIARVAETTKTSPAKVPVA